VFIYSAFCSQENNTSELNSIFAKVDDRRRVSVVLYVHFHILFIHSIALACAECDDSLPFSGTFSVPLCYIPFPSTLFYQPVFYPPSLHLAICFLVYLSASFPDSYLIPLWEFYFLPFSVHAQTTVIYFTF